MLRFLGPLRARWQPLDRLLRAVEAYGSLADQAGFGTVIKWVGPSVTAGIVAVISYLSQSWILPALAAGFATFVALVLLRSDRRPSNLIAARESVGARLADSAPPATG